MSQEAIALGIVGIAALVILYRAWRTSLAEPLAKYLLKRGKIRWAMRIHPGLRRRKPGSDDCCSP